MRQPAILLGVLVVAACGVPSSTAPRAGSTATPPASASPSSPALPATSPAGLPTPPSLGSATAAHLTITGSTTYHVASTRSRGPCGASPAGYAVELELTLGGQAYVLSMDLTDYSGPGSYSTPPGRVSLHTETGAAAPKLAAATAGGLTVNADQRSGSIDATMSDRSRVTGTWACTPSGRGP